MKILILGLDQYISYSVESSDRMSIYTEQQDNHQNIHLINFVNKSKSHNIGVIFYSPKSPRKVLSQYVNKKQLKVFCPML